MTAAGKPDDGFCNIDVFWDPSQPPPEADIAGVVSIARVHLDAVPESLLSVAASQSPEGEVVRLSSWHKPSVAVVKVIAISRTSDSTVSDANILRTLGHKLPEGIRYPAV